MKTGLVFKGNSEKQIEAVESVIRFTILFHLWTCLTTINTVAMVALAVHYNRYSEHSENITLQIHVLPAARVA